MLLRALTIPGGAFSNAAISSTAWLMVGSLGQEVVDRPNMGQRVSVRNALRPPKSSPPSPAHAAPHSHKVAVTPANREVVEDLIDIRMARLPVERLNGLRFSIVNRA